MQDNNKRIIGIRLPNTITEEGLKVFEDLIQEILEEDKKECNCGTCNCHKNMEVPVKNLNPFDGKLVRIGKEFTFDSAHHLIGYEGDCANVHGHTYKLEVSLVGYVTKGFIVDFKELKLMVNEVLLREVDHKDLNQVVNFNPTAENLAVHMYNVLETVVDNNYDNFTVDSIKLYETPGSYVEYWGADCEGKH